MSAQRDGPLFVIKISDIPNSAKVRELRKAIGVAAKSIRREPPIRFGVEIRKKEGVRYGKLFFTEGEVIRLWLSRYGSRLGERIVVKDQRLTFAPLDEVIDKWQISAINNQIKDRQWEGSDYDDIPEPPRLSIVDVSCGAWDSRNAYCQGWGRLCQDPKSCMTFDVDETKLSIRIDDLVIETVSVNILHVFLVGKALYIELGHPPLFLREIARVITAAPTTFPSEPVSKQVLPRRPRANYRRLLECQEDHEGAIEFDRVGAFDSQHMPVAQYCNVFRVGACTVQEIKSFYDLTQRRLPKLKKVSSIPMGDPATFSAQTISSLNAMFEKLSFEVAFQAQALIGPRLLPLELLSLRKQIVKLEARLGPSAAPALRSLKAHLCDRGPIAEKEHWPSFTLDQMSRELERAEQGKTLEAQLQTRSKTLTHTAQLTPSYGCFLDGPHLDDGNRILRQYPGKDVHFLRVRCIEENGSVLRVSQNGIQTKAMIEERFGTALRQGIVVAGRRFQFLAFSGSSLRESSCWFMRPFQFHGTRIRPDTIRQSIGALDHIRCPAKYAARMGQAFTATPSSIEIHPSQIKRTEDVEVGKYCFTDGIGTISPALVKRVTEEMYEFEPPTPPTVFQVRIGGAKGVLAIDTRLEGEQVNLRNSMVKFEATSTRLEIANVYRKPLPMFLNRPMVALLESLGVPKRAFMAFQNATVQGLRDATRSVDAARALHLHYGMGLICSDVLSALATRGINGFGAAFLREANLGLVNFALRNVKYRARIRVPNCYTLLGALDETGELGPKEVVVAIGWPGEPMQYLEGRCLVGRSPMTAPGDVQFVTAVIPAVDSPLRALRNALVFSQKGMRPVPSMLAGGDLDGDLYNVIQEESLLPKVTYKAATYPRLKPQELDRNCTVDDVITFFLQFIEHNVIGIVANHHLHLSDRSNKGVVDRACIRLAALHSIAVDYCKTGIPAPVKDSPYVPAEKPDYFMKEYRLEGRDSRQHPRERELFYQSRKALGEMFRAIDVQNKLTEWSRLASLPLSESKPDGSDGQEENSWSTNLWDELKRDGRADGYYRHQASVTPVLDYYDRNVGVLQRDYSPFKRSLLSEEEVFMGCIIERGPTQQSFNDFDHINRLQDEYESICRITRQLVFFRSSDSPVQSHFNGHSRATSKGHSGNNGVGTAGLKGSDPAKNPSERNSSTVEESLVRRWILYSSDRFDDDVTVGNEVQKVPPERVAKVKRELIGVITNGLAFYSVALKKSAGRSAPWIVVPAILRAHRYLDAFEGRTALQNGMSNAVFSRELKTPVTPATPDEVNRVGDDKSEGTDQDESNAGDGLALNNDDLMLGLAGNIYEGLEVLDSYDEVEKLPSPERTESLDGSIVADSLANITASNDNVVAKKTAGEGSADPDASQEGTDDDDDDDDFGFEAFTRKPVTGRGGGAYMTSDEEASSDEE